MNAEHAETPRKKEVGEQFTDIGFCIFPASRRSFLRSRTKHGHQGASGSSHISCQSTFATSEHMVVGMKGKLWAILLIAAGAALAGCNNKLETGYEPNKVGSLTAAQRRGLYAQDFTPEAQEAENDQASNNNDTGFRPHTPGQP
jgi:hypothetical protein